MGWCCASGYGFFSSQFVPGVLSHTRHILILPTVKLPMAHWWASQTETRRNFYFCFVCLNQDCHVDINNRKYFQDASFSGLFPRNAKSSRLLSCQWAGKNIHNRLVKAASCHCHAAHVQNDSRAWGHTCRVQSSNLCFHVALAAQPLSQQDSTAKSPSCPLSHPFLTPPPPRVCTHADTPPVHNPSVRKQFLCLEPQKKANLKHARIGNGQGARSRAVQVTVERTQTWRWKSSYL